MKKIVFSLVVYLIACGSAWATISDFTYDYTVTGNTYTFELTVINNHPSFNLDFFLIELDADADISLYSNVAWVNDKGWTSAEAEYDPAFGTIPAAIFADDATIFGGNGGIAPSATLSGFKFKFDYTGSVLPTMQNFSFLAEYDTHWVTPGQDYAPSFVETGNLVYVHTEPHVVPEPNTLIFFGIGLAGMGFYLRRKY